MNGNDRNTTHDARITRLEVSLKFLVKRLDDLERRMEAGFRDLRTGLQQLRSDMQQLRRDMHWLVGFAAGTLLAVELATLALVMRGQHLL
jgi:surfactin synthase thioesterase subunit